MRIGAWILVFLLPIMVRAQFRFDQWTTENGLPSNSIWSILQTRDGYLWITTSLGLVRFDGVRMVIFDKSTSPDIKGTRFSCLFEDRSGNLWAATEDGGLIRHRNGEFRSWTTNEGLPSQWVDRVDEDATGAIWAYTDKGRAVLRGDRFEKVDATGESTLKDLILSNELFFDRYKTGSWRRDAQGWNRFSNGVWSRLLFPEILKGRSPDALRYLWQDVQGRLWYGLPQTDREQYANDAGRLVTFRPPPPITESFYQDRQGRLWTRDQAGEIFLWKDGHGVRLPAEDLTQNRLADRPIISQGQSKRAPRETLTWYRLVHEDREGNIWLATYDKGLLKLVEKVITFMELPGESNERYVYPLMEARDGSVWFNGGTTGLMRYKNGRFTRFPLPGAENGPNELSSLYEDRDGTLWTANYQNMVARWKNGDYRIDQAATERINGRVDVIQRDRAGNLWFGGKNGLHRLSSAGEWTQFGPAEGLASQHVKTMVEDASGRLWIGGYGGVSLLEDGRFRTWTRASGLPSDRIMTLHADSENTLWIGSYDGGLYRLRQENAGWRLTTFTTREGLYSNQVQQIIEDDLGFLWMGCGRGIYRVRKQEMNDFANGLVSVITSTHYGKADGLMNLAVIGGFQPAGFKARDGRLWFPTQDGIAVIDPRRLPFNPNTPPVIIEECKLDLRNVPFRSGLRVVPGQENLEINYTALSFIKSEQIRFRYKLEGHDRDWTEAGQRRTAYYSQLPSGTFTFKVVAANSDGVWNMDGASLTITVVPPFYRTLWFRMLSIISLSAVCLLALRARIRQLNRRNEQQQAFSWQLIESQEQERKRIASELHDSLGQQLLVIKNWAAIGINSLPAPRQTRESFDEISEAASQAIEEIREAVYNLRPYQLDKIGLTSTLRYLIERVAAASGIEIHAEIPEIDDLFSLQQQVTFYRIVQECLTNIVKHAKATTARVAISRQPLALGLTIEDNGCGFEPDSMEQGLRPGLGLMGMRERVRILGGKYAIHSVPGNGVKVQITIDLRKTHERNN